jgi:hypothetical protein
VKVQFELVHVAPTPRLAGLERLHDRMLAAVKVFGGVFVFRGVATTDMATLQAQPQVHPGVPRFQTLLAALSVRRDLLDLVKMLALFHGYPFAKHAFVEGNGETPANRANRPFDDSRVWKVTGFEWQKPY